MVHTPTQPFNTVQKLCYKHLTSSTDCQGKHSVHKKWYHNGDIIVYRDNFIQQNLLLWQAYLQVMVTSAHMLPSWLMSFENT